MAGVISGFDKGKCAALVAVEMTSFGCTVRTEQNERGSIVP